MEDLGAYTRSLDTYVLSFNIPPQNAFKLRIDGHTVTDRIMETKIIMETIIMEKKKVRNFSIIDRRRL